MDRHLSTKSNFLSSSSAKYRFVSCRLQMDRDSRPTPSFWTLALILTDPSDPCNIIISHKFHVRLSEGWVKIQPVRAKLVFISSQLPSLFQLETHLLFSNKVSNSQLFNLRSWLLFQLEETHLALWISVCKSKWAAVSFVICTLCVEALVGLSWLWDSQIWGSNFSTNVKKHILHTKTTIHEIWTSFNMEINFNFPL